MRKNRILKKPLFVIEYCSSFKKKASGLKEFQILSSDNSHYFYLFSDTKINGISFKSATSVIRLYMFG